MVGYTSGFGNAHLQVVIPSQAIVSKRSARSYISPFHSFGDCTNHKHEPLPELHLQKNGRVELEQVLGGETESTQNVQDANDCNPVP